MPEPKIAGRQPVECQLEAGKKYAWCSCGHSANQPFCDGSHKGSEMGPLVFTAEKDESAWLCMCKRTGNPGRCDGSHASLNEGDA